MVDGVPFSGEPGDSREAIMHATFCALQQHGYAGLSIQRIADEAELSKSTFYHHFDGKEDLLLSFLEFILDTFDQLFQLESSGDPHADLKTFVSLVLGDFPHAEELPDRDAALRTYVELRAHAVRTPEFRAKFTETDHRFTDRVSTIIEEGIEEGVFADVDPEQTAQFLLTMIDGIVLQNATREDDPVATMQESLETYIDERLVVR
ncbi:TetR/AcrR family transcriptional regulator [Haloarcula pelagica]|uniref:TetR/AcrR family transcriptional regulator n=1 Tax=Haloarcula pelagica TaxID=3033389 RepID=UPI0024C2CBC4|nr:TetR/AcrR family transcriptional regulator [Halomicroarcula sp. YJ-61-S]